MSARAGFSLKASLIGAVGLLAAALAGQGWLSIQTSADLNARVTDEAKSWLPRIDILQELAFDVIQLRVRQARHILKQDDAAKARVEVQMADITRKFEQDRKIYEAMPRSDAEKAAYAKTVEVAQEFWKLHEKLVVLSRERKAHEAIKVLDVDLKPASDAMRDGMRKALEIARTGANNAYAEASSEYATARTITFLVLGAGMLAGLCVALFAVFRVSRPMNELTAAMQAISAGNLETAVPHTGSGNELGTMARTLAVFRDKLAAAEALRNTQKQTAADLRTSREQELNSLRAAAEMIASVNDITVDLALLDASTREVTSSAQTIAAASVEMATSVQQIAQNSENAAGDAGATGHTVETGRSAVGKVTAAMGNIVKVVEETAKSVDELSQASEQIGQIISVIEGIASQTNLLALNATIEAARAGEAGRGFAVVASEVKHLANQTSGATEDIAQRIAHLRAGMGQILNAMELSKNAVGEGQGAIGEASATMESIAGQVGHVSQTMQEISTILLQQKEAAGAVSKNVDQVANTASENERRLREMSRKLYDSNDRFAAKAKEWFRENDPRSLCEMAKIDHVLFKKRVVDAVSGHDAWAAKDAPDHHACRLGKWYDAVSDAAVRAMPEYAALVAPHGRVHAAGKAALAAREHGDMAAAINALGELNAASHDVLKLLDRLSAALSRRAEEDERRRDVA